MGGVYAFFFEHVFVCWVVFLTKNMLFFLCLFGFVSSFQKVGMFYMVSLDSIIAKNKGTPPRGGRVFYRKTV